MKATQFDNVTQHIPVLHEFALKFTSDSDIAKDLVQDTMLNAIRYYGKFEQGTNLSGWLFTIMRNNFINSLRRNKTTATLNRQSGELTYQQELVCATQNGGENRFVMGDIKTAINQLPELLYIPFMRHVEGYKYQEIAVELNTPIGTIKTRIFEARRLLKKQLHEYKNFQRSL